MVKIEPEQVKAARAMLGWSQEELSERTSVSRRMLVDYENGTYVFSDTILSTFIDVFAKAGVSLIATDSGSIGACISEDALMEGRLRRKRSKR